MLMMQANGLVGREYPFRREHYQAVGSAYSQAFALGFFFCLCMVAITLAVGSWLEQRKRPAVPLTEPARAPGRTPLEQES